MTANDRRYEDYMHFMPEKERKSLGKALSGEDDDTSAAEALIRFQSRERSRKLGNPEPELKA